MFKLNKKCDLTYDQALDTTKTIIGLNWADLQKPMGAEAIEIRDAVAKTIVDNLFNKETKKIYTAALSIDEADTWFDRRRTATHR